MGDGGKYFKRWKPYVAEGALNLATGDITPKEKATTMQIDISFMYTA